MAWLAAASVGTPASASEQRPRIDEVARRLPHQAPGFVLRGPPESDPAPGGGEGIIASYIRPSGSGNITVYVYDQGRAFVPDGPESEAVVSEFGQVAAVLALVTQRRTTANIRADVTQLSVPGGATFLCAILPWPANERTMVAEFACLTGAAGRFLKIRVTAPYAAGNADQEHAMRRVIEHFLGNVAASVSGRPPRPVGSRAKSR